HEMAHQKRANAAPLPGVRDHKGHFCSPSLDDNESAATNHHRTIILACDRDKGDMSFEIDVEKEPSLLVGEIPFRDQDTALEGVRTGPFDGSEHIGFVLRVKCPDLNLSTVAERFTDGIGGEGDVRGQPSLEPIYTEAAQRWNVDLDQRD